MIRNILTSLLVCGGILTAWPMVGITADENDHADHEAVHEESHDGHGDSHDEHEEVQKGPHGGRLLEQDDFTVELSLYETGVPPEFHVYVYQDGKPLAPDSVELEVELARVDGQVDHFSFSPLKDYLRGQGVVSEPHSFDVTVHAQHADKSYEWGFSSYEGRTEIPAALAQEADIETGVAGPALIAKTLTFTGRVQTDPARLAQVRARFDGVVQGIEARLGEQVDRHAVLARIQSNESLQTYTVKSPIGGVILRQDIQLGMATGDDPLFIIADLSEVWVELDIFARNIEQVKPGQSVIIETLGGTRIPGQIDWIAPLAAHASQSVQARVIIENPDGKLRPGQFVRGRVVVAEHEVALAVRQSAIQRFRDFQVVFARFGDTYEVRMLELGRNNSEWVEVLGGLKPGTEYVTGNSYLIKADIEKSGASHDH
ncbi:MAG: efflux RND transporter periplasmic adaptor subunit [Gammaproteobacteria bacterium]|nr:efflux RND transporter periplasmic adaptor subunit [Gammaproteobacteria bacterium]